MLLHSTRASTRGGGGGAALSQTPRRLETFIYSHLTEATNWEPLAHTYLSSWRALFLLCKDPPALQQLQARASLKRKCSLSSSRPLTDPPRPHLRAAPPRDGSGKLLRRWTGGGVCRRHCHSPPLSGSGGSRTLAAAPPASRSFPSSSRAAAASRIARRERAALPKNS